MTRVEFYTPGPNAIGPGVKLLVDGEDITGKVRSLTISSGVGELNRVVLYGDAAVDVSLPAEVVFIVSPPVGYDVVETYDPSTNEKRYRLKRTEGPEAPHK